jgi:hypothetical protein
LIFYHNHEVSRTRQSKAFAAVGDTETDSDIPKHIFAFSHKEHNYVFSAIRSIWKESLASSA